MRKFLATGLMCSTYRTLASHCFPSIGLHNPSQLQQQMQHFRSYQHRFPRAWDKAIEECPYLRRGKKKLMERGDSVSQNKSSRHYEHRFPRQWDKAINACPYLRRGKDKLIKRSIAACKKNSSHGHGLNIRVFRPRPQIYRPAIKMIEPQFIIQKPRHNISRRGSTGKQRRSYSGYTFASGRKSRLSSSWRNATTNSREKKKLKAMEKHGCEKKTDEEQNIKKRN